MRVVSSSPLGPLATPSLSPQVPGHAAYPTSLTKTPSCCTVTAEDPNSTMTREMLPLGSRRSWTLKVGEVSLQMAAKM